MKNTTLFLGNMCIALSLLTACTSENEIETSSTTTRAETIETITVNYNGERYLNIPISFDENGDFIFLDKEFSSVYENELADDENLSIHIKSSDEIEFFHSLKLNLESNGYDYSSCERQMEQALSVDDRITRLGYEYGAIVELFDDKNFADTKLTFRLTPEVIAVEERRLKYQGFNDKCSSLIVTNNLPNDSTQSIQLGEFSYPCSKVDAVFIGYEDKDFSKKTITFIATPGTRREATSLPNFNDKMSSFKFFFAQQGQYHE